MTRSDVRVLLVEDDEELLELMACWLQRRGIATCPRSTFDEALQAAQAQPFDVAAVDGHLRGRSGVELVEHLRRTQPEIRVIFISGHDDHDHNASQDCDATERLLKPFALAELQRVIDRALAKTRDAGQSLLRTGVRQPEETLKNNA
jgi:two-component system NtrC family response regulator/two-component system response regulator AtoC